MSYWLDYTVKPVYYVENLWFTVYILWLLMILELL